MADERQDGLRIPAWAQGPAELFRHAEDHFNKGTDTDRRLALIGFDNAIEVCVDAFVSLHPRNRNGYKIERGEKERILQNYHTKVDFLEGFVAEHGLALGSASVNEIIWYHQLRNELYHSGNGMTPERQHIIEVRDAARAVFRALFRVDVLPPGPSPRLDDQGLDDQTGRPQKDASDAPDLNFLAAYIELEKALGRWAGFAQGRAQLSVFWARFREEHQWTHSYEPLVKRSRELRNDFAHGQPRSSDRADVERMTLLLRDLSQRILREVRANPSATRAGLRGRKLAERLWLVAREFDAERKGMSVLSLLDLIASEGIHIGSADPARAAYDALKNSQDLFERSDRRFVWSERSANAGGLSGAQLRQAVAAICPWINEAAMGRHYYDILRKLAEGGVRPAGPNPAGTLNRVLANGAKRGAFQRLSAGTYRCGSESDSPVRT